MTNLRTVLITGSAGHLGRAIRAAFEELGDKVVGVDCVAGPQTDIVADIDKLYEHRQRYDVVICNAKTGGWFGHAGLASQADSSIINIGSIYGLVGSDPGLYSGTEVDPSPAWYAASKGALIALTRWQATNLAPVRSNAVCPGGILRGHSDEFQRRYSAKVPLRRMATEADIVPLVVFLADPIRAAYITGVCIPVDGGGLATW